MSDKIYDIRNFKVSEKSISFTLSGQKIEIPLEKSGSKLLPHASPELLQIYELDDDGIGVYWPMLDEDLSIAGLLRAAGKENLIVSQIESKYVDEVPKSKSSAVI